MLKHISLIIVIVLSYFMWDQRPVKHGAGVIAPEKPSVVQITRHQGFEIDHYKLQPKWKIESTARVLSQKRYWLDEKTNLAPYDIVLGWGAMSDERILSQVQTPIGKRDFRIEVIRPPLTFNEIRQQILFMHAVPANDYVRSQLAGVRTGNVISFTGYVVDVNDRSGLYWKSSMSNSNNRLDSNQIVYIESIEIQ